MKQHFFSGTKWEPIVGYSRAVRIDQFIWVTGTTATNEQGEIVGVDDPYLQTKQAIQNIELALKGLNASLHDVVRTRMFVTDISRWEEIGKAHHEFFADVKPATTMVEVSRLIDPRMMVEIEVDAFVEEPK